MSDAVLVAFVTGAFALLVALVSRQGLGHKIDKARADVALLDAKATDPAEVLSRLDRIDENQRTFARDIGGFRHELRTERDERRDLARKFDRMVAIFTAHIDER